MSWYEKNWSPVKLKNVAYPMAGVSTNSSVSWYDKLIEMSKERSLKLEKYNAMDLTVDISRALDIIAEDISSDGADDNETFKLEAPEHVRITAANIKSSESVLRLWKDKTEFEYKFFDYIRETLKYGLVVFEKNNDGTLKKLIAKRIEGYKLDSDDDNKVTHYIYDDAGEYINMNGDTIAPSKEKSVKQKREIPVKDLLILKTGESPLGDSILDRIYRPWKQLQLLEDAIIIYRIVRAPERRIFYIDVGNMPSNKAQAYIEGIKNKMRQKQINKDGVLETEYNPACLSLDTKIPLLDGRELMLSELIEEYDNGKENWTYSCDPITGEVMSGVISWAGLTRKNTNVIKLTFDNGETLTCTPDHKIPVLGKGFTEAQDLLLSDSLISYETRLKPVGSNTKVGRDYKQIYDHSTNSWKFVHRMVAGDIKNNGEDFKAKISVYNHKIVSIEYIDDLQDVGTLTIDQDEKYHNHHTFAISAGIFVKNSMQEDFFLGSTGDGRGSKVETLSGGDNLGQIEDLQFFNKKLSLGLRIPPSYLDSYSEDINGATQNDGRLGTAYIAELRYVGYVKRLQKKIARALSEHFRNFAGKQDVEINEDLIFMIEPPQSFAIYKQNELDSVTLNAYGSAEGVDSMSKRFAMKRYLQLEEDEIVMNEELKLQELGLDEKILKKLPDYIRYNFIYGDGEAARSYVENELVKAGIDVKPAPNLEQGGME